MFKINTAMREENWNFISKMKSGDSFFVPAKFLKENDLTPLKLAKFLKNFASKYGFNVTTKSSVSGVQVWRDPSEKKSGKKNSRTTHLRLVEAA